MKTRLLRRVGKWAKYWLPALVILIGALPAFAQALGSGSTGGSSSGFGGGGTTGGGGGAKTGGGTGSTGGSLGGTSTGGRTTGGTSSVQVPTTSNPFQKFYVNGMSQGIGSTVVIAPATNVQIGTTSSSSGSGGGGSSGGSSSSSGLSSSKNITANGNFGSPILFSTSGTTTGTGTTGSTTSGAVSFNTMGMIHNTPYRTETGETVPLRRAMEVSPLQVHLQGVLDRSTMLTTRGMRVSVADGGVVILQGQALTDHERRIAEGVVRMSPGVREVRNDIVVAPRSNP